MDICNWNYDESKSRLRYRKLVAGINFVNYRYMQLNWVARWIPGLDSEPGLPVWNFHAYPPRCVGGFSLGTAVNDSFQQSEICTESDPLNLRVRCAEEIKSNVKNHPCGRGQCFQGQRHY